MSIVTGDRYLEALVRFMESNAGSLLDGSVVLKLNPAGLRYVQSRIESLGELEGLRAGAPVEYLRAYVADLGDHRALEQLRRILRLLTSLKVISVLSPPARDPTPLFILPFGCLRILELRFCDLSTSSARGLLELRNTLERLICYNSTDALRHVFADRIMEIQKCLPWSRLSFVSCPYNGLIIMDESLHLLPGVETLDLSRNQFAKVDNLHLCKKLRYLDLGFNGLSSISSLNEVACPIVKLVLRNNALKTLHGIENLKTLEGLDLSFNLISNFSEIERLGSLPSLQDLLLEGNPMCYANWYRAQVFSYFKHPKRLKLDQREIGKMDYWKVQLYRYRRWKKPSGYGFYSPVVEEVEGDSNSGAKRKKLSRVASIGDAARSQIPTSEIVDQESQPCVGECHKNNGDCRSDDMLKVLALTNKTDTIRKASHYSSLDIKGSGDESIENLLEHTQNSIPISGKRIYTNDRKKYKQEWDSSKSTKDSLRDSGDGHAIEILDSGISLPITPNQHGPHHHSGSKVKFEAMSLRVKKIYPNSENAALYTKNAFSVSNGDQSYRHEAFLPLNIIGDIAVSHSDNIPSVSYLHYQQEVGSQQNLDEEGPHIATGSYSNVSSDTDTSSDHSSCCMDDSWFPQSVRVEDSQALVENTDEPSNELFNKAHFQVCECDYGVTCTSKTNSHPELTFSVINVLKLDDSHPSSTDDILAVADGGFLNTQREQYLEKIKLRKTPRRRVVSLSAEIHRENNKFVSWKNASLDLARVDMEEYYAASTVSRQNKHFRCCSGVNEKQGLVDLLGHFSVSQDNSSNEFLRSYFDQNVADSEVSESCQQYVLCSCIGFYNQTLSERQVALVLSSENKFYVLLKSSRGSVPGTTLESVACHRLIDIKDIIVGIGLHLFRVQISSGERYLFMAKTCEKWREMLDLLLHCESNTVTNRCSLRSWEQVQVNVFDASICSGLKMNISLYSMILVWHECDKGESWISRSIFLVEGYILICIEDLLQFGSLDDDLDESRPYFSLDACCSICDITEMVIELMESKCVTLILSRNAQTKENGFLQKIQKTGSKEAWTPPLIWRFKWFSEESLLKFVGVLKAMYAGAAESPLIVKSVS